MVEVGSAMNHRGMRRAPPPASGHLPRGPGEGFGVGSDVGVGGEVGVGERGAAVDRRSEEIERAKGQAQVLGVGGKGLEGRRASVIEGGRDLQVVAE